MGDVQSCEIRDDGVVIGGETVASFPSSSRNNSSDNPFPSPEHDSIYIQLWDNYYEILEGFYKENNHCDFPAKKYPELAKWARFVQQHPKLLSSQQVQKLNRLQFFEDRKDTPETTTGSKRRKSSGDASRGSEKKKKKKKAPEDAVVSNRRSSPSKRTLPLVAGAPKAAGKPTVSTAAAAATAITTTSHKQSKFSQSSRHPAGPPRRKSTSPSHPAAGARRDSSDGERESSTTTSSSSDWFSMYMKLSNFRKAQGHCDVTRNNCRDESLIAWVDNQRRYRKSLQPERVVLLNQLGFSFRKTGYDVAEQKHWEQMYAKLVEYKAKYGDASVPRDYKPHGLGKWLHAQHTKEMLGELDPKNLELLHLIGVDFEALWLKGLAMLSQYRAKHGYYPNSRNSRELGEEFPELLEWIEVQARSYMKGSFRPRRKHILDEVGFVFQVHKDGHKPAGPVENVMRPRKTSPSVVDLVDDGEGEEEHQMPFAPPPYMHRPREGYYPPPPPGYRFPPGTRPPYYSPEAPPVPSRHHSRFLPPPPPGPYAQARINHPRRHPPSRRGPTRPPATLTSSSGHHHADEATNPLDYAKYKTLMRDEHALESSPEKRKRPKGEPVQRHRGEEHVEEERKSPQRKRLRESKDGHSDERKESPVAKRRLSADSEESEDAAAAAAAGVESISGADVSAYLAGLPQAQRAEALLKLSAVQRMDQNATLLEIVNRQRLINLLLNRQQQVQQVSALQQLQQQQPAQSTASFLSHLLQRNGMGAADAATAAIALQHSKLTPAQLAAILKDCDETDR